MNYLDYKQFYKEFKRISFKLIKIINYVIVIFIESDVMMMFCCFLYWCNLFIIITNVTIKLKMYYC